jgi:hypothetical protein
MAKKWFHWQSGLLAALVALTLATPVQAQGIKYLPKETEVIVSVNLKQVWNSKLVKDYSALIKQLQGLFNARIEDNPIAAELKKSLGIDLFNDVDQITMGLSHWGRKPTNSLMVLEGKFDQAKFNATGNQAAKEDPEVVKPILIANTTVFQITPPQGDIFFMAMPSKNTLMIAATKEDMTSAITPMAQNLKKEVADLVKKTSFKKSLNMIMTAKALQDGVQQGPQAQAIQPFLNDLEGAIVSANVVSDIDLHVTYLAKNEAGAKQMADKVNDGLKTIKALAENSAQLAPFADILNSLKASTQDTTMTITGSVPRKTVDNFIGRIENFLP